jgi:hypothetical protein
MGSKRLETEARVAVTEETTERGMAATQPFRKSVGR